MELLEHKLRLLRNSVKLDKSAAILLRRDASGTVCAFGVVFANNIAKLVTEEGSSPRPPDPAYQQIIEGAPFISFTTDELLMIDYLEPGELYPGIKAPEGITAGQSSKISCRLLSANSIRKSIATCAGAPTAPQKKCLSKSTNSSRDGWESVWGAGRNGWRFTRMVA